MEQKLVNGHTEIEEARRKEKELEEARKLIEKEKAEAARRALELQKKDETNFEL
jgi:kinesin family protein 3/17